MKKHRKGVIAGITTLLVCAATAAAYFLIVYTFSGEGSSTAGKGTPVSEPLTVNMGAGVTPGNSVTLTLSTNLAKEITLLAGAKLTVTYTTSAAECKPEWFTTKVTGTGAPEVEALLGAGTVSTTKLGPGLESLVNPHPGGLVVSSKPATIEVSMKEEPAVNQTACESATITTHAKLVGTAT